MLSKPAKMSKSIVISPCNFAPFVASSTKLSLHYWINKIWRLCLQMHETSVGGRKKALVIVSKVEDVLFLMGADRTYGLIQKNIPCDILMLRPVERIFPHHLPIVVDSMTEWRHAQARTADGHRIRILAIPLLVHFILHPRTGYKKQFHKPIPDLTSNPLLGSKTLNMLGKTLSERQLNKNQSILLNLVMKMNGTMSTEIMSKLV